MPSGCSLRPSLAGWCSSPARTGTARSTSPCSSISAAAVDSIPPAVVPSSATLIAGPQSSPARRTEVTVIEIKASALHAATDPDGFVVFRTPAQYAERFTGTMDLPEAFGGLLVHVALAGVNYWDVMQRAGAVPLPASGIPGVEGAPRRAESRARAAGLLASGIASGSFSWAEGWNFSR